jgi:hypothetical protein
MSKEKSKEFRMKVKEDYKKYLKDNKVENSQMVLVFCYLFLLKVNASETVYSQFMSSFLQYLELKKQTFNGKKEQQKKVLFDKIQANTNLV